MSMEITAFNITLGKGGTITADEGKPLMFGFKGNKGIYKVNVTLKNEWKDCIVRAHWHYPFGEKSYTTLVVNGELEIPSFITRRSGTGLIVFEGVVDEQVITTANLHYLVKTNAGITEDEEEIPDESSWQQFVKEVKGDADNASQYAKESEAWAHGRDDYPDMAEDNAKYYADLAKQAAEQGGYLIFDVGEDGYLYLDQKNVNEIEFAISDTGELEVTYGE